jgi:hypothetical protein
VSYERIPVEPFRIPPGAEASANASIDTYRINEG